MRSPKGESEHKQRLVDVSNPLVRETITKLSGDATDFDVHLILFDLCLRMYYTGLVDGANAATALTPPNMARAPISALASRCRAAPWHSLLNAQRLQPHGQR